jgi:hypothetical protein
MIYGIEFTILDLIWCVVAVAGVAFYGLTTNYKWISPKTLALWLVIKLLIGLGFTLFSVLSDIEFDGAGYFLGGQTYAGMIKDLISGNSFEYLTTYPFWWIDGRSTDRLCSLAGLFVVLTGGSFLGATSIACVFGAIGQLFMFRFFRERFPEVREVYFLPVLFHPSLMMWSGMLIKDTFGIFALGWAVYSIHCLLGRKQLVAFIPFALSVYIIYLFRSFIFLPLAAFSLFIVWDQVIIPYTNRRHQGGVLKILYFISATAACGAVIFVLVDKVGSNLLDDRRDGAETFSQIEAGSSFENVELSISPLGLLRMGLGTINSLLRPFPWDVRKPMQAAAAVENLVILYFVGLGL